MDSLLCTIEAFGKVIFCLPAESFVESRSFRKLLKPRMILFVTAYAILLFEGIALLCDVLLRNKIEVLTCSPKLSEHLGYYFQYGAVNFSDFIIRATGLIFARDAFKLFSVLRWEGYKLVRLRSIPCAFMLVSLLLVSTMVIGYGYALVEVNINYKIPPDYVVVIAPREETGFRIYIVANSICVTVSVLFSYFFIIAISTCLVCWLQSYSNKCCRVLQESVRTTETKKHLQTEITCSELRAEFMSIRNAFEGFGRFGGMLCLTLLIQCSLLIIRFLSGVAIPVESSIAFLPDSHFFCYLLPFAIAIIGILGSMMTKTVRDLTIDEFRRWNSPVVIFWL